jgi:hypothetical protein
MDEMEASLKALYQRQEKSFNTALRNYFGNANIPAELDQKQFMDLLVSMGYIERNEAG